MQTVILKSKSKSNIKLLTDIAKKIGVEIKILNDLEKEEIGLSFAIKEGRTKEYINTEKYLSKLRK